MRSLGKTLLAFALLHSVLQGQICLLLQVSLEFLLLHSSPLKLKTLTPWKESDDQPRQHIMVNTEIRLIIFFAAKDGEALYSQQKQDWELTVAQIMNALLPNSDLN